MLAFCLCCSRIVLFGTKTVFVLLFLISYYLFIFDIHLIHLKKRSVNGQLINGTQAARIKGYHSNGNGTNINEITTTTRIEQNIGKQCAQHRYKNNENGQQKATEGERDRENQTTITTKFYRRKNANLTKNVEQRSGK